MITSFTNTARLPPVISDSFLGQVKASGVFLHVQINVALGVRCWIEQYSASGKNPLSERR